jgi:nitroreductase
LDWENQPAPFRTYEGGAPILLPLLKKDPGGQHLDLYERTQNFSWDFNVESIAGFLELSLGLSAWKSIPQGNKWALRMNPSSGNLHPTEAHLILPSLAKASLQSREASLLRPAVMGETTTEGGVYHYHPYLHALETRASFPAIFWDRLRGHFQAPGFLIALTSIYWREAWKYGERALRYCHHDAGHALAALSFAGNLFGWKVTLLTSPSDFDIETLLGLGQTSWPEQEQEKVEFLCFVSPAPYKAIRRTVPSDLLNAFAHLSFQGKPNRLSQAHVDWPLMEETSQAAKKPRTAETSVLFSATEFQRQASSSRLASEFIRQRRSATALDATTSLTRAQFFALLDKTLPRNGMAPFDVELGESLLHLAIFVHRVVDLESGLYFLLRNPDDLQDLKRSLRREFSWEKAESPLPLYRLLSGDFREKASQTCCLQAIAGDGVFSLAMIARFGSVLEKAPWRYPALFWEAGMIGQVLYLEAEAHGVSATGIGCYFDDSMHEILGLKNHAYQSVYHFTIGGAVPDRRLTTELPYVHLPADRK